MTKGLVWGGVGAVKPHSSEMCIFQWLFCSVRKSWVNFKKAQKHRKHVFTTSVACTAIKERAFLCFYFLFFLHICCSSVWESKCVLYVFFTQVGLKFYWFKKKKKDKPLSRGTFLEAVFLIMGFKLCTRARGCSFIEDLKIGRVLMAIMLQSIPWKLYKIATRSRSSSWIFSVCLIQSNHHFWSCTVIAFSDGAEGWANQK